MSKRDPWAPESGKDWQAVQHDPHEGGTDFESLMSSTAVTERRATEAKPNEATDFQSIKHVLKRPVDTPRRTWNDTLIDGITPLLILIMTYAVVYFLLDVRYIYTAVHDMNIRFVAFAFILGVVALNRLIARDGSKESFIYMAGLAGAIAMYTFATTGMFDVGSVANNFMNDNPYAATAFNMMVVVFLWWLVNRLTHECCVDENRMAGDVGIITGTARRWQKRIAPDPAVKPRAAKPLKQFKDSDTWLELEPFDPTEGYKPPADYIAASKPHYSIQDRWGDRHPGMAIFYFSLPVFLLFAIGLRVIQHGGEGWVKAGAVYMGIYTVSALSLLMLTSLSHLREYFRMRKVRMPEGIAWFWIGLGLLQIAVVLVAALQLPLPELPPIAYVAEHTADPWNRGAQKFELTAVARTQVELVEQAQIVERIGRVVLGVLILVFVYGFLKALGAVAARMARQRVRYPKTVMRIFDGVDKAVSLLTKLPKPRPIVRRTRISRELATCMAFKNSMSDEQASHWTTKHHIEQAYAALCALAYDMGVPREAGQTPYEFLSKLPRELHDLEEEAAELTRLYVVAAYSPIEMDDKLRDRLRKFWIAYERLRRRHVK